MPFQKIAENIPDVMIIKPECFYDERGFFTEIYKREEFEKFGINANFVQVNQSRSKKDVLRGLHYQLNPMAQGKLIRVLNGEIFDVAVDIRKGSPWYGKWVSARLSSDNRKMLYAPKGFAHGFLVLSQTADIEYYCDEIYSPDHERGIIWNDSELAIEWPVKKPILSKKDLANSRLMSAENNFKYAEK